MITLTAQTTSGVTLRWIFSRTPSGVRRAERYLAACRAGRKPSSMDRDRIRPHTVTIEW